jgi:hypothetical protein
MSQVVLTGAFVILFFVCQSILAYILARNNVEL